MSNLNNSKAKTHCTVTADTFIGPCYVTKVLDLPPHCH